MSELSARERDQNGEETAPSIVRHCMLLAKGNLQTSEPMLVHSQVVNFGMLDTYMDTSA